MVKTVLRTRQTSETGVWEVALVVTLVYERRIRVKTGPSMYIMEPRGKSSNQAKS